MATLADIAKKCGTSSATVSYVLSGQGDQRRISPAMQSFILQTADELDYRRKKEKKEKRAALRIAVFWPERHLEHALLNVIDGINSALLFENIPVQVSYIPFGYNSLIRQSALWSKKVYDAAVIFAPNTADLEILSKKQTKIATVLINRSLDHYSSSVSDFTVAGKLIAEHAITKGGDNIAIIHNSIPHMGLDLRNKAIYKACHAYHVDLSGRTFSCNNKIDDAYELGIRMLRMDKLPKVLICSYDIVAYGLIRAFNEAKLNVGQDVEVLTTGISFPQLFSHSTPSITVVDIKMQQIAQKAARLAIDLAVGNITKPLQIVTPPEIICRESSPAPDIEQLQRFIERKRKYMIFD